MFWDIFIIFISAGLGFAGWNIGLINSWRGPLAIVIATVVTKMFYVDFATWIVQQALLQPLTAIILAYLMLWLVVEIMSEVVLNVALQWNVKERPVLMDRIGGVLLWLFKGVLIITLPAMASQVTINVPSPPKDKSGLELPCEARMEDSHLVDFFKAIARSLKPTLAPLVTSEAMPSFKPNFDEKIKVE